MIICKQCIYWKYKGHGPNGDLVPSNHICLASPLSWDIDPFDGKRKPTNFFGTSGEWLSYHSCIDINHGDCSKFRKNNLLNHIIKLFSR